MNERFGLACSMRNIEYAYPASQERALAGLNLDIKRGEWLALLGSNGSGKSTLAKIINALLIPTQGECLIFGMSTKDESLARKIRCCAALVFQNPDNQIVASVVEEEVAFGPENLGLPSEEIKKRVAWSLKAVGLEGKNKAATYALSGGQKQRLALAGALAMEADILILDEATSMIDPTGREEFLKTMLSFKGVKTIIQITHRLEETIFADRAVVLQKGKINFDGTPLSLYSDTARLKDLKLHCPPILELRNLLSTSKIIPNDTEPNVMSLLKELLS